MEKVKVFLCVVLPLGLAAGMVFAGEEKAKEGFSMGGVMGATVLTDPDTGEKKVYSRINLQPELAFGKFGMGIDIDLYFDENNNIRNDWQWKDLPEKIMYVRWGHKREPLFIWYGGLKSATLGHGLIMNRYTNMLFYPDKKIKGLEVDVNMKYFGFESLVNNINKAEIFGGRVYARPLAGLSLPLLPKLALGVSAVTDPDPDGVNDSKDEILIYGADIDLPIFENPLFSAILFGDVAQINLGKDIVKTGVKDKGTGAVVGLMGKASIVNWRAEYRRSQANFIPGYFDSYYDVDRSNGKALKIASGSEPTVEGPYAEVSFSVLNKVSFLAFYENSNQKTLIAKEDDKEIWDKPRIHAKISAPKLIEKVSLELDYDKRDVRTLRDVYETKGPNTLIETHVGYWISPNVSMVIVYRQKYDSRGRLLKSTSMETKLSF